MSAVNVGIGHNDYLVITELFYIELIAYTCAQSCYNRHQLFVADNLIKSCLFNVEHFTPEWENSLNVSVSALF